MRPGSYAGCLALIGIAWAFERAAAGWGSALLVMLYVCLSSIGDSPEEDG